jgi:hypothetical protein
MVDMNKYETLTQALKALSERGFVHSFKLNQQQISCVETKINYLPQQIKIIEYHRFEGASNPDDTEVVYAIECKDGTLGTIVDAYGLYADASLADFLKNVEVLELDV